MHRYGGCAAVGNCLLAAARHRSESRPLDAADGNANWTRFWKGEGQRAAYPSGLTGNQNPRIRMRKTHIEWRTHHGSSRIGQYDATRELPDFEHADGTPMPLTRARFALKHFYDKKIAMAIRAAALVEEMAETNRLPRVPGVREQRAWDPQIPLFLEVDDPHGAAAHVSSRVKPAGDFKQERIDAAFDSGRDGRSVVSSPAQEGTTLEPLTLFASYSPAEMFRESQSGRMPKRVDAFNRRRWNLGNEFIVQRNARAKNTIPEGGQKAS